MHVSRAPYNEHSTQKEQSLYFFKQMQDQYASWEKAKIFVKLRNNSLALG